MYDVGASHGVCIEHQCQEFVSRLKVEARRESSGGELQPATFIILLIEFQANINSIGSLSRQIQRGSKSQEILQQTVKNLTSCEASIASSEVSLARLQVVLAQLQSQHQSVEVSCDKISQVR